MFDIRLDKLIIDLEVHLDCYLLCSCFVFLHLDNGVDGLHQVKSLGVLRELGLILFQERVVEDVIYLVVDKACSIFDLLARLLQSI